MSAYQKFWVIIGGLVVIIIATIVLVFTGHTLAAMAVSQLGTLFWMLGAIGYIALLDSKRRWPKATLGERLTAILTFQRRP